MDKTIEQLEKRIAELEAEVAKLKAQPPEQHYHYHYAWAQPTYAPQPFWGPPYPQVWMGSGSAMYG